MKTVLVVDDDPDIRDLVIWKLKQAGYATISAADGQAGLAAARGTRHASGNDGMAGNYTPDLVLLDWMMPKATGIEVCRALRQDPNTAGIPVVMLTAKAQEVEMKRGLAAGADDYIVKPFSPRELLNRVEAVLARSLDG